MKIGSYNMPLTKKPSRKTGREQLKTQAIGSVSYIEDSGFINKSLVSIAKTNLKLAVSNLQVMLLQTVTANSQLVRFFTVQKSIDGTDASAFAITVIFYLVFAVEIFNRGVTVV